MATVYGTIDPRFARDVAIKILPLAYTNDPFFRARFQREARTIAAVEHSAIIPVYDFGQQSGQPYLVTRLMSGGSLADKLGTGPLSVQQSAAILQRISGALDAAHAMGIMHRDVKPGNLVFDKARNAYLADFGSTNITQSTVAMTGDNIIGSQPI